jgi:hypothetical protein
VRLWRESGGDAAGSGDRAAAARAGALLGRVVGFSGFMPIRGTLRDERDDDVSPPPRGAPQEERPL